MPATIAGSHLGIDIHANRPAANAAGQPIGALYSCSTHGLIYKTDGSTWSTYATLGSGTLSDQGVVTYFDFTTAAAPSSPAAGKIRLYSKTGDHFAQKDSSGTETLLDATGGGGGAQVFLERHAASASSSLDFTAFISATYDKYLIVGESLVLATSTADLRVEIGTGGGPTYDTGNNYEWARLGLTSGGGATNDSGSTGIARIFKSISTAAAYGFGSFSVIATGLQSTALRKTIQGTIEYADSTPLAIYALWGMQWTTSGTAATALRFIPSSGAITSGSITIYGLTNS